MAKQKGIFKVKGTLDDITFFKSIDGHLVRIKGGVNGNRIKNDPAFQRTRENGAEFGRAGKAGKLLRSAIRPILQHSKDVRTVSRLTKEFVRVIKADLTSVRGQRNVIDGEINLLDGFEFNINSPLSTTLFAPYTSSIDRATGKLEVDIPSFIPANMIAAPDGASHFMIVSSGTAIDFTTGVYVVENKQTAALPLDGVATAALSLQHQVTAGTLHPMLLLLGIQFLQDVNGTLYPLKNGAYNALAVVKAEG